MALDLAILVICSALFGALWTRVAKSMAHRLRILDEPDPRKVHREPIAYLGGFGILMGFLMGLVVFGLRNPLAILQNEARLVAVIGGAVAIFAVGLWDDVRRMKAVTKLLFQILVGLAMWMSGLRVVQVSAGTISAVPGLGDETIGLAHLPSILVTVGWYVALMNAMNLIDGLDGLAGGVATISALSVMGVGLAVLPTDAIVFGAAIAALVAGSCLGFLVFNWHPARIFLGDAGSLLLGYLLATAALIGSTKASTLQAMLVPLVAVGLPLFEAAFSFLRRALRGTSPFKPDRRHLHHRLLDLGLSQQRVVLVLLFATAFLGINSVLLARAGSMLVLLNVAFLGIGLILLIENLRYLERKRTNGD